MSHSKSGAAPGGGAQGHARTALREALSAAVDGEASELELRRVVNALGADGSPPLVFAAVNANPEFTVALLDGGADVDAPSQSNGATALHAAAFLGNAEVARLLLEKGADAHAMTNDGMTAMQMTELDWATTEYIAGMLQIAVEQEAVMAGRAKIAEMLTE